MFDPDLAVAARRAVVEGDPKAVALFSKALSSGHQAAADLVREGHTLTDGHTTELLRKLLAALDHHAGASTIGPALLDAAAQVRDEVATSLGRPVLVWTGPEVHGSALRATAATMRQLIDEAQSQIILVTYSLRPDRPRPEEAMIGRLGAAARRRVAVTVVLHQNSVNREALYAGWPAEAPLPRLLTWPVADGDELVKLHAKILSVDDRALLITSANVTYHGLFANLEMGLLVRSPVAGEVRRHFDRLEGQGYLIEWS